MQIKLNTYVEPTFGNPTFLVIRYPRGPVMSDYRDSTLQLYLTLDLKSFKVDYLKGYTFFSLERQTRILSQRHQRQLLVER